MNAPYIPGTSMPTALACEICRHYGVATPATETDPDVGPVCKTCAHHCRCAGRHLERSGLVVPTPQLREANP